MHRLCIIALCADLSIDLEHPSVFLDDDSDLDFHQDVPSASLEALIDSPSLSPISAPADFENDAFPQDASQTFEAADRSSVPNTKPSLWERILEFLDNSPLSLLARIIRSLCGSLGDTALQDAYGRDMSHSRDTSSQHHSAADYASSLAMHHIEYDACLVSIYSPEFILESIAVAESRADFFNPRVPIAVDFSTESPYNFPGFMGQSSLQRNDPANDLESTEFTHRLHALLQCQENPIQCAVDPRGIGIPHCVCPVATSSNSTLSSFTQRLKRGFEAPKEKITEVTLHENVSLRDAPIHAQDIEYITFGDIKHWLDADRQHAIPQKQSAIDAFMSKLRLLDTFELPAGYGVKNEPKHEDNETYFDESVDFGTRPKRHESIPKDSRGVSESPEVFEQAEFTKRFGDLAEADLSAIGIFMVPRDANSRLLRGLHFADPRARRQRLVNSTSIATVHAQESYQFADDDKAQESLVTRHKRYRFQIPEDRMLTLLLTCPIRYRH